jgi:hypothetical protein
MELRLITLGDGVEKQTGWLVISNGVARAILAPHEKSGRWILLCTHDRRIDNGQLSPTFPTLELAGEWIESRLEPNPSPSSPPLDESAFVRRIKEFPNLWD